ncbi:hypothetical protein K440DRAFT_517080, partial [Wilcoxina mikolae CBS 423.85]
GSIFHLLRILEILTLIPIWGILSWFINAYYPAQAPDRILFLFIVSLLATIYAFITLLFYRRHLYTPLYICIVDICFFGLFVAGLVLLAPSVQNTNCVDWSGGVSGYGAWVNVAANKQCMMLKSAWGLGIVNAILFVITAVAAWEIWHGTGVVVV